jgi:hypothetical protein
MSYKSCLLPGLFVLRWGAKPEVRDVELYAREIATARAEQGQPLVALFIMPTDSGAPDELFRKAQATRLPEIMQSLEYAVAVFEGSGFISSLKRSALVAILLLAPKKFPVYVRATVEEALISDPPGRVPFDPYQAIHELRRSGVLTDARHAESTA